MTRSDLDVDQYTHGEMQKQDHQQDVRRGVMCESAFDHELGEDYLGTPVYPDLESLHNHHKSETCGVVEVEIKKVRQIKEPEPNYGVPEEPSEVRPRKTRMAIDYVLFKWMGWKHLTIFGLVANASFEGDHSPGFYLSLTILGLIVFEIEWYNVHHVNCFCEECDGPAKPEPVSTEWEYAWLVELFDNTVGWQSLYKYHTGLTDLQGHSRSTTLPYTAKRYDSEVQAQGVCDDLNKWTVQGEWRATRHAFKIEHKES